MGLTRRSVLAGAGGLAALAGCLSEPGGDDRDGGEGSDGRSGYAAFFPLWDWSEQVGGDAFGFENPVGVGEPGHGWSPDQGLTREAADTDVFVYLDGPEFAWAQDVAAQLEEDYDDVAVVDAMAGLESELLQWEGGHDHAHDETEGHDAENGTDDHSHGDGNRSHREGTHAREDANHTHDENHSHEHGDHSHDDGNHSHDDSNHSHDDGNHTEGGGASARHDPHVWVDPVLAREMVGTIAEGLGEVDPDNAETYEDNAAEYGERLAGVDEAFEELVASAGEVAVLAGHDSFRYVEQRYGFELHTPVSASPEESPSASEIAGTIEVIEDEGIDTVLYDPFEAPEGEVPPLAETIVENSPATETAPVTPGAGTTAEWDEEGWGWVEQMEEVTLPSLRQALGAE